MPKNRKASLSKDEQLVLDQLGKRIKALRIREGFSNYEHFAYESGISRTQYGKYEIGDNMKFLTLIRVLKTMNVSPGEFFSEGFGDVSK